jgi:hypothetical protein
MTTIWKRRVIIFGAWTLLISVFSLSNPFGISFFSMFPMLIIVPASILTYLVSKDETKEDSEEVSELKKTIEEYERVIEEDFKVLSEYEDIFDSQLVELPCICGGNTFKGLFSPKLDNLVQCEKCKNQYKVSINYDTILLSEPMDQTDIENKLISV